MTRWEFLNNITTISELLDFCYDENLETLSDIYSEEERDDAIWEEIHDFDSSWSSLAAYLDNIPTGYEYYQRDADHWFEYSGIDDSDFDALREQVLRDADECGVWEEEDEYEYEEDDCDSEESSDNNDEVDTVSVMSLEELYAAGAVFTINN